MSRGRKILIGVGVVAVLGVLAARAVMAGGEKAVTVRAEDVERRDLVARVRASGHMRPPAHHRSDPVRGGPAAGRGLARRGAGA
jgi:multidrug efflux pump subunit AcrA (membrane-fusion protein)